MTAAWAGDGVADILERDAVISDCGLYRYLLRRTWDHDGMRALFIMLNPSIADAEIDDPTIRSCIRLCRSWGYGSFEVVNLFGWRATDPKALAEADDPVGPKNDHIVKLAISRCDTPICAWGANQIADERKGTMLDFIGCHRPAALCLGHTKNGAPKHPLYIKTGTMMEIYRSDDPVPSAAKARKARE